MFSGAFLIYGDKKLILNLRRQAMIIIGNGRLITRDSEQPYLENGAAGIPRLWA